ncbi:MAG: radical SAM protein, partial [Saprospiraceae bacterium]|nr:radical SAM protein [Saprospiraceae bacterium]
MNTSLLDKYNIPAPRYTSYPTVPYWQSDPPSAAEWESRVVDAFSREEGISLYIHLPFCERLCTYCGCNKRITKNHGVEEPYMDLLLKEWQMYLDLLPGKPLLRDLHLGGGTPTFFSAGNLERLIRGIAEGARVEAGSEFGFEAHPASTSKAHLEHLYSLGFRRLSVGVQDFDPHILALINRRQTTSQITSVSRYARRLGYTSINYDLIFGLPLQTIPHIERNMEQLRQLRPERVAFYSYAHVPWIKPSQRAYSESDLPRGTEKRALYERGREMLEKMGYEEIGLDHFALPHDALSRARKQGYLHRNFMGYTPQYSRLSIGLG